MDRKIACLLKKQALKAVLLSFLFVVFFQWGAIAQTAGDNSMGVGLGVGLWQSPQESDFDATGTPMNLFFDWDIDNDWLKFRAGYSTYKAEVEYSAYGKTWTQEIETTNIYIDYRYSMEFMSDLEGFAIAGVAMSSSSFTSNQGAADVDDSGMALHLGGGAFYYFGDFGVGGQLEIYSRDGDFEGVTIATGSTQLQLSANYSF